MQKQKKKRKLETNFFLHTYCVYCVCSSEISMDAKAKQASEWVQRSERMSAAERASKATSAYQANEWLMRANERADERMTEYSMRRFCIISSQSASIWDFFCEHGWRNSVFHHMHIGMAFLSIETWHKERNRWLTCSLTAG